jgi:hypothetical protein
VQAKESKAPKQSHGKAANKGGSAVALPLHKAAFSGNAALVKQLLQSGADPTVLDGEGKTAYAVAASKGVKDAMRRYMAANPHAWNYGAAQIPSTLTEEMEEAQVRFKPRCRLRSDQQCSPRYCYSEKHCCLVTCAMTVLSTAFP